MSVEISVVIPTFNEEGNISMLYNRIKEQFVLANITEYEILFINDGSSDRSLDIILELAQKDAQLKYISFSKNFGHQNALKAGWRHVFYVPK